MATKKEPLGDTVAELKAVREARSEGCWRIIQPHHQGIEVAFVKYSEEDQYNLMSESEYKTEQKAALALALMTRPMQLTHIERVQLLSLLEE